MVKENLESMAGPAAVTGEDGSASPDDVDPSRGKVRQCDVRATTMIVLIAVNAIDLQRSGVSTAGTKTVGYVGAFPSTDCKKSDSGFAGVADASEGPVQKGPIHRGE
jgi:hypothetical protein